MAAIVLLLCFFYPIVGILPLFFFTFVFALIRNAHENWLEKVRQPLAGLIVCFVVLRLLALLGWLVVPMLIS